ncbi:inositol polyphosphate multikinase isoform X2 [Nilaparvata lugens]|nr:inositol polyphosphate multikinase isoform X2 [Nilaparvata lugens]
MANLSDLVRSHNAESHCIHLKKPTGKNEEDGTEESIENDYPKNTRPLESQVAGHEFMCGKIKIGMLKHEDGYLMKPIVRPVQGERELAFYEQVQQSSDPILSTFKTFIPEYYGSSVVKVNGTEVKFILLKDMTHGFKEPCIMDVKIGKQTWEPGASAEKEKSEKIKYADSKNALSFCIPGFQVYDVNSKIYSKFGKDYGKQMDANGVYEALRMFLNHESGASKYILPPVIDQLRTALELFKNQKVFHIYSSSILMAYDAAVLRQLNASDSQNSVQSQQIGLKSWYCVSLIDFAHVVPANDQLDFNYISGIQSLVKVLENIQSS